MWWRVCVGVSPVLAQVILSFQNEDGGWATYENTRAGAWYEILNPSEVGAAFKCAPPLSLACPLCTSTASHPRPCSLMQPTPTRGLPLLPQLLSPVLRKAFIGRVGD
jgi:hypothetical protein